MSTSRSADPDPAADPARQVERFFAALEAGDTDGLMVLLDDEFVFRDPDSTFAVGKDALRTMMGWDSAARTRPVVSELRASGDTVRCTVRETNAFTELLGLGEFVMDLTFVVRGGRIREEVVRERGSDGPSYTKRFNEAVAPVLAWAEGSDPEALRPVLRDDGGIRYDGESARALLALIRAWRAESTDNGG